MLRHVALLRTDVSEERIASKIRVTFFCSVLRLLVTADVVPISLNLVTLTMEAMRSSETSVPTRAARRNIPDDGILQLILLMTEFRFINNGAHLTTKII
jgi:hypothetical protein